MITYLLIATIWSAITERLFEGTGDIISWQLRIFNFFLFPISTILFTYTFIKEFNKPI
jgi:hypothetical protein